jgi:hypothetical protein
MCHNKDISDSPFFNIFSNLPLRPFTRDEATELIVAPSEREGVPIEAHADRIIEMAGTFPLFLQVACSNVFEYLVDNPDADPNWREIDKTYMSEVEQHYRHIWEHMDSPTRDNLARIAAGKTINKKFRFINEELERRGYIVESRDGLKVCSSSFREFVMKRSGKEGGRFFGSLFRGKS